MMKQQPFLPKDVEYQALRRFVKMVEASSEGSMSENMASALAEELTPRQQQVVHMYYVDQMLMRQGGTDCGGACATAAGRCWTRWKYEQIGFAILAEIW